MDKKKIGLIGLGVGILSATVIAGKSLIDIRKEKSNDPIFEINKQVNILNDILNYIEGELNKIDYFKDSNMESSKKNNALFISIKNIQKKEKAISKLENITNIPNEISDLNEDLNSIKESLLNSIKDIDVFRQNSINNLTNMIEPLKSAIESLNSEIECEMEDKAKSIEKLNSEGSNKKHNDTYSYQVIPSNRENSKK